MCLIGLRVSHHHKTQPQQHARSSRECCRTKTARAPALTRALSLLAVQHKKASTPKPTKQREPSLNLPKPSAPSPEVEAARVRDGAERAGVARRPLGQERCSLTSERGVGASASRRLRDSFMKLCIMTAHTLQPK